MADFDFLENYENPQIYIIITGKDVINYFRSAANDVPVTAADTDFNSK